MDTIHDEDYYGKCGELFLTVQGSITFHCTLCESRYKGFQEYKDHVLEVHYSPDFNDEFADSVSEEDSSFHTLSEKDYLTEDVEFFLEEEEEIEVSPTENEEFVPDQVEILYYEPGIDNQEVKVLSKELPHQSVESISVLPSKTTSNLSNKVAFRNLIRTRNVNSTITDRKYKCPHCNFSGANRNNMNQHIKRHSLNKPHKCTECPKAFHTRTELRTHLRTHTGERPYLCTLCGQAFTSSSMLNNHQKSHGNKREKECSICKMSFFTTKYLNRHMKVHSDKRNYKCQQCDAAFKSDTALKTHIKLHENKREYQCKLCESRFNQNAGLYSHMKTCHSIVFNASKGSVRNEIMVPK